MYGFFNTRLRTKDYGLMTRKGFTLIELLVVVAIIGILSTVVFATIGGTRGRARDAKRLAEVKEAVLVLVVLDTSTSGGNITLDGCAGADARLATCSDEAVELAGFADPSGNTTGCAPGGTTACDYSISKADGSAGATTGNYQICFFIEDPGSAGLSGSAGVRSIRSDKGGAIQSTCL